MTEYTEHVRVKEVDSCTVWNSRQPPGKRKSHEGGRDQFQNSVTENSQYVEARLGYFHPCHTQAKYK